MRKAQTKEQTVLHSEFQPQRTAADEQTRISIDDSAQTPTVLYFISAVFWLLVGSLFGILASVKFNLPDWLGSNAELTFGRVRPAHLNDVAYGWISLAGAGMIVWLTARLCRVQLQWAWLHYVAVVLWNLGVLTGTIAILTGYSQGLEWLEFPRLTGGMIAAGFLLFAISIIQTFRKRRVEHLYVSLWYILASMLWFPFL